MVYSDNIYLHIMLTVISSFSPDGILIFHLVIEMCSFLYIFIGNIKQTPAHVSNGKSYHNILSENLVLLL